MWPIHDFFLIGQHQHPLENNNSSPSKWRYCLILLCTLSMSCRCLILWRFINISRTEGWINNLFSVSTFRKSVMRKLKKSVVVLKTKVSRKLLQGFYFWPWSGPKTFHHLHYFHSVIRYFLLIEKELQTEISALIKKIVSSTLVENFCKLKVTFMDFEENFWQKAPNGHHKQIGADLKRLVCRRAPNLFYDLFLQKFWHKKWHF